MLSERIAKILLLIKRLPIQEKYELLEAIKDKKNISSPADEEDESS